MKKMPMLVPVVCLLLVGLSCAPQRVENPEVDGWQARAERVTIIRDEWGIPHVYGKTDADAVFGTIYAQAEDDFHRIEVNFLNAMGRLAEAEGKSEIYRDLRMKLFIDPEVMKQHYAASPPWLQALMDAWADGLNYFLHQNPGVEPAVLTRFEPWMALTFSEGSIGGDIERVSLDQLERFYRARGEMPELETPELETPELETPELETPELERAAELQGARPAAADLVARHDVGGDPFAEPTGSNGFAIAPSNSATGQSLLLINPHTSFYFRSELHMVSEEGLNAYGAVTWGQFFVYQGFNETAGWMHTSTGADAIDEYRYEIEERADGVYYRYGDEMRRMDEKVITIPYRQGGAIAERVFTTYHSHHGPVVRGEDDSWISVKLMNEPMNALIQSYSRTKAANHAAFKQTMELHTNSSNNTVFADAEGNIAYFHANFIPIRDPQFDWNEPVDGSDPATEWRGLLAVDDSPNSLNPPNGWIQNTNNWPYSVAGEHSPKQENFPAYVETWGENARGRHALRVLEGKTGFTLDSLIEAAYDSYLSGFEALIPALLDTYDRAPASTPGRAALAEPIELLRAWDLRFGVDSVATALAIYWGNELVRTLRGAARQASVSVYDYMLTDAAREHDLEALGRALATLTEDFGDWRTPWGEINRFQRLTGDIVQPFGDAAPSTPVAFASGRWGSLASFGTRTPEGMKRRYGRSGNSFVAVVAFGDRLEARAITAGGASGDPSSPHFDDQIERYAAGDLRPVHFYREDVDAHARRTYRPGG